MTDHHPPDTASEKRAKRIAADFRPNETYDRLLELRDAGSDWTTHASLRTTATKSQHVDV